MTVTATAQNLHLQHWQAAYSKSGQLKILFGVIYKFSNFQVNHIFKFLPIGSNIKSKTPPKSQFLPFRLRIIMFLFFVQFTNLDC
jgi:hypothetical protein